jgi:Na+/H+-translocating membrane pyrophosphatase
MFQKQTLKAFSIVAIVLSAIGLLLSILGTFVGENGSGSITFSFILGIISWSILLWSSIIATRLCSSYQLYEEQYKKVGYCVYAIIVTFILFLFVGLVLGIILSVIIFGTLWSLKSNLDDWANSHPDFLANELESENK